MHDCDLRGHRSPFSEFRRELVVLVVHHEQPAVLVVDGDRREGQFFIFDTETICLDVASGDLDVGVVEAEVVVFVREAAGEAVKDDEAVRARAAREAAARRRLAGAAARVDGDVERDEALEVLLRQGFRGREVFAVAFEVVDARVEVVRADGRERAAIDLNYSTRLIRE